MTWVLHDGSAARPRPGVMKAVGRQRCDLAIDWAKQAADFGLDHQSRKAADYWCKLLAEHRPDELLDTRFEVFRR